MADSFPDMRLFDEWELICKDNGQLALEIESDEVDELKRASNFASADGEFGVHSITEQEGDSILLGMTNADAVSCNLGVDLGTELKESSFLQDLQQKTLLKHGLQIDKSCVSGMLPSERGITMQNRDIQADESLSRRLIDEGSLQGGESADAGQNSSVRQKRNKTKILESSNLKSSASGESGESKSVSCGSEKRACKRKQAFVGDATPVSHQFKSTKRTKRYLEKPFGDPELERSRLNAINAKINRERKKQEVQLLNQKCENLSSENHELSETKQKLEAQLRAAEDEVAFLRKALLKGCKSKVDTDVLKYSSDQTSAPAGASVLSGK